MNFIFTNKLFKLLLVLFVLICRLHGHLVIQYTCACMQKYISMNNKCTQAFNDWLRFTMNIFCVQACLQVEGMCYGHTIWYLYVYMCILWKCGKCVCVEVKAHGKGGRSIYYGSDPRIQNAPFLMFLIPCVFFQQIPCDFL